MTKVSEDMLMAYADGELDGEMADAVRRAVDADPALVARLAALRRARALAKASYADVLEEPVPRHLLAAVGGAAPPRIERRRPSWRAFWLPAGCLAAAAVAGLLVAPQLLDGPRFVAGGQVAHLLDTVASGETVATADGRFEATATWPTEGGVCRGFATSEPGAATGWRGVGCRHDGAWTVDLLVADRTAEGEGVFAPASDRAVQSVDAFLDSVGAGPPLDDAEEAALRARGWRTE